MQLERLDLLRRITHAIAERQDLDSIFQVVVRSVEEHLPADFAAMCDYRKTGHADRSTVRRVGARSEQLALELAMTERARIEIDQNGLARCVAGELVYEPDISAVNFPFPQRLARGGLQLDGGRAADGGARRRVRRAGRRAARGQRLQQRRVRIPAPALRSRLAGRQPGAAARIAAAGLRRSAPHAERGDRAGAAARARPDGERHRARHQQRHLAGGAVRRCDARRTRPASANARASSSRSSSARSTTWRNRGAHGRVLSAAAGAARAGAGAGRTRVLREVLELTRARWSDMAQQRGVVIETAIEAHAGESMVMAHRERAARGAGESRAQCHRRHARRRQAHAAHRPRSSGKGIPRRVFIEVGDTGVGMDEETRRRCLEPFFTTKGERGSGLGLAMVYGIAQRHGVDIDIKSAPGEGTTFRLTFPRPRARRAPSRRSVRVQNPGHTSILLIDDDPVLLTSLREVLAQRRAPGADRATAARPASRPSSMRRRRASPFRWSSPTSACRTSTAGRSRRRSRPPRRRPPSSC